MFKINDCNNAVYQMYQYRGIPQKCFGNAFLCVYAWHFVNTIVETQLMALKERRYEELKLAEVSAELLFRSDQDASKGHNCTFNVVKRKKRKKKVQTEMVLRRNCKCLGGRTLRLELAVGSSGGRTRRFMDAVEEDLKSVRVGEEAGVR